MNQKHIVLTQLIEPVVTGLGYQLWGIEREGTGAKSVLRIYIDKQDESGIDVDDCQKVSQQVVGVLDVEDPIKGPYTLEVSSPGLDRLFFEYEQFQQFVGETIDIRLSQKLNGRKHVKGELLGLDANGLQMHDAHADAPLQIDFTAIDRARLVPNI